MSESTDKRAAVERMAKRLYTGAKQGGGSLTYEQAKKISGDAVKRNDRDRK